jgi:predicted metal-dependent hydrolase
MDECIFILGIFIFIYIFLFINRNNNIYVESKTGTKFLVYKDELKNEKAILLGDIVEKMYILKNHLIMEMKNDRLHEYKEYIKQLEENFTQSRTVVYETDPESELTSYSVNKGEELSVCLKSKKSGKLHDLNLLIYVAVHEMAHFACPEIGHGKLFQTIFKKFIEEAITIGIYKKVNFESIPTEYCGMILSSSIV